MPVYILQAGDTDNVKIGWAAHSAESRRDDLQAGCWLDLRILRVMDGDRGTEGWLHRRFSSRRIARDWFAFDPTMLTITAPAIVTVLPSNPGLDDVFTAFGGRDEVQAITGAKRNAVNNWRMDGVPFKHWPALIQAAASRGIVGITFETLESTRPTKATPTTQRSAA